MHLAIFLMGFRVRFSRRMTVIGNKNSIIMLFDFYSSFDPP